MGQYYTGYIPPDRPGEQWTGEEWSQWFKDGAKGGPIINPWGLFYQEPPCFKEAWAEFEQQHDNGNVTGAPAWSDFYAQWIRAHTRPDGVVDPTYNPAATGYIHFKPREITIEEQPNQSSNIPFVPQMGGTREDEKLRYYQ